MPARLAVLVSLLPLAPLAGCDDTLLSLSSDGRLEIRVNTGGDPSGGRFRVRVDGGAEQTIGADGTVTLAGLSSGSHSVLLTVPDQCQVEGSNPKVVTVGEDGVARVGFVVGCAEGEGA